MGRPKAIYAPLTMEKLRTLMDYDPETGYFLWKIRKRAFASKYVEIGQRAGSQGNQGYWVIGIDGKVYQAHRLAWLWMNGSWPEKEIDHVNLVRSDNRWSNLRAANDKENCANRPVRGDSATGIKGVSVRKSGRYRARISRDGKRIHLGDFDTPEEANRAYALALTKQSGEFARVA